MSKARQAATSFRPLNLCQMLQAGRPESRPARISPAGLLAFRRLKPGHVESRAAERGVIALVAAWPAPAPKASGPSHGWDPAAGFPGIPRWLRRNVARARGPHPG